MERILKHSSHVALPSSFPHGGILELLQYFLGERVIHLAIVERGDRLERPFLLSSTEKESRGFGQDVGPADEHHSPDELKAERD